MLDRSQSAADEIREVSPAVAVAVTAAFLDRHPDWRVRYGARATTEGVKDAGYHLAFLAGAVESGHAEAFASYAQWAAGVLAARGIAPMFLAENLEQLRLALEQRLPADRLATFTPCFRAAAEALAGDAVASSPSVLNLTADVFLQAITTSQRHAAVQIAREALAGGLSLQQLYVDVFQPALYEVGRRWEANLLTVAQEHIATAITQYVMAQVYEAPDDRAISRGPVVLTGVEGELHNIGAVMVGDLLETAGWRVRFLGSNLPAASILSIVRETMPSHIGISATMLFNVPAVRQLIAAIRAEFRGPIRVVVGGAAFRTAPDVWRQIGADGFGADLRSAQALFSGSV
jgi:methanogenic corrinoid protein MtbC1